MSTNVLRLLPSAEIVLVVLGVAAAADAQAVNTAPPEQSVQAAVWSRRTDGEIVVRATRVFEPIQVDGRLGEDVYENVDPITDLVQQEPDNGAPISERTEVWLLYDDENIYVSCRCWDSRPDRIFANDLRRDSINSSSHDHLAIHFDTFHDGRNGFLFYVTAAGALKDSQTTDERPDTEWNGIWAGASRRFDQGYISEMAIPFRTLRYRQEPGQTWGIQLRRFIRWKNERAHLTALSPVGGPGAVNRMSEAATLVGLEVPPPGVNLEVKPYAISRLTTDRLSRPPVHNEVSPDIGGDLKYGISKSMTLDVTINTDFAQVEADEAQVNLTRFNLVFPEKRDFFLEGAGVFTFANGLSTGGTNTDQPTMFYSRRIGLNGNRAVPVLGGGRFTGTVGPWTIGAFSMETGDDPSSGARQTNFTVARVRRNILARSNVGAIMTRRSRSTRAPGAGVLWGVDGNFGFHEDVYVTTYVAQSHAEGFGDGSLSYRGQFNYEADRYGLRLERLVVGKDFDPEVGILRRDNFKRSYALARFSPRTTGNRVVRQWNYQANVSHTTDDQGRLESREVAAQMSSELHNSDSITARVSSRFEFLPAPFDIARGVRIPEGGYDFRDLRLSYTAGQQRRVSGTSTLEVGSFYSGNKSTLEYRGRVDFGMKFGVEPNISYNWINVDQGTFTTKVVGGRATFTMTPRMFVAALLQYASSGATLTSNVRFRWEYRPGSELFVVYSDGRSTAPLRGTELETRGLVIKINRLLQF